MKNAYPLSVSVSIHKYVFLFSAFLHLVLHGLFFLSDGLSLCFAQVKVYNMKGGLSLVSPELFSLHISPHVLCLSDFSQPIRQTSFLEGGERNENTLTLWMKECSMPQTSFVKLKFNSVQYSILSVSFKGHHC